MMTSIDTCALPRESLLQRLASEGAFTDCYTTQISRAVSQTQFVEAFYSTAVFGVERLILNWALGKASTLSEVKQLAAGAADSFAAWKVEARTANQLLLADFKGRTRSWLMTEQSAETGQAATQLFFGSAVMAVIDPTSGQKSLGAGFQSMLWFHQLYSRVLLSAAKSRLLSQSE